MSDSMTEGPLGSVADATAELATSATAGTAAGEAVEPAASVMVEPAARAIKVFGFSCGGCCAGYDNLEIYELDGAYREVYSNRVYDGLERSYDVPNAKIARLADMLEHEGVRAWRAHYGSFQEGGTRWSLFDGEASHEGIGACPANFEAVIAFLAHEFGCEGFSALEVRVEA